jgi:hypothetical protein
MKGKRRSRFLWVACGLTALLSVLLILALPTSRKFSLGDGTKVCIVPPSAFGTLHQSIYHVIVIPPVGAGGEVDLRGDFDHSPIIGVRAIDASGFYLLYDCDVILRLIKVDTRHTAHFFGPTSALNWIVRSSPFKVEQAGKDDWKAFLASVEAMSVREFERQSLPVVDIGIVRIHPQQRLLLPRMRKQVEAMFGGMSTFYDYEK